MSDLYVDCDDTLILWNDHQDSNLIVHDDWLPNMALIHKITELTAYYDRTFVWSGGGRQYALRWAQRCLDGYFTNALSKDIFLPQPGDTCIDDQVLKFKSANVKLYTYQDWLEWMEGFK